MGQISIKLYGINHRLNEVNVGANAVHGLTEYNVGMHVNDLG